MLLLSGTESLLTTVPGTVEQSLEISLKKLKEKREASGRPENVDVRHYTDCLYVSVQLRQSPPPPPGQLWSIGQFGNMID